VSISHAGRHVACCIADRGEVGVDLEVVDLRRHAPTLARRFFAEGEADWLQTQPKDRFFMLWVLKEAYVKALGCGIFGGLNGLQCVIEPPYIRVLDSALDRLDLALFELDGAYLAVASTDGLPDEIGVEFREAAGPVTPADPGVVFVART
jgi:4'-phosphopantetheinyl transferase